MTRRSFRLTAAPPLRAALCLSALVFGPTIGPVAGVLHAADEAPPAAPPVSYHKQVRPIFQARCQGCHQPAKQGGEYLMTSFARLLKGGESGKTAVVPGKPEGSHLLHEITPKDGKAAMPEGGEPLAAAEIALIRTWIAEGAKDDSPAVRAQYDSAHPPTYSHAPVVTSLDFSPDGKLLAAAGYHEVLLTDPADGKLVGRLVGLSPRLETVRFSPDGKRLLVVGGTPGQVGEVQTWDVEKRELLLSRPITGDVIYGGSWSPDGKYVAFGCGDNSVRAIDASTGEQVVFQGAHTDWVRQTTFSADGSHLVSVGRDMTVKLTEFATQRFVDNITSITPGALKGGIQAVARHPQRDEIVIGGSDGSAKVYRIQRLTKRVIGDDANLIRKMPEIGGRIFGVAVAPDGKRFAACTSLDGLGRVRIYSYEFDTSLPANIKAINEKVAGSRSAEEKAALEKYHTDGVKLLASVDVPGSAQYAVAFAADGTLAAAGADGLVRLIDPAGKIVRTFSPAPVASAGPKSGEQARPVTVKRDAPRGRESTVAGREFVKLEISPAAIVLPGRYEKAQLLVTGTLASGETFDVTRTVDFKPAADIIDVSSGGYVQPKADGKTTLAVSLGGLSVQVPVEVRDATHVNKVDFIRDVNPVLSRMGCNQGTCHGAAAGKNGFKLSLRGYDPIFDLRALADELAGRRINFAAPDDSLMLAKPTGVAPHVGGVLFKAGDPNYEILRTWIADGAKLDLSAPRVTKIEVLPTDPVIPTIGSKQQMRVIATYADGTVRDVTREAFIESGNGEVAVVDATGLMTSERRGEAPVLARYEGAYAATTLTVMGNRDGFEWQEPVVWNRIDELTAAKWKRMKIRPSELSTDTEFLRRVYLDLTGLPPTAAEVRKFMDDPRDVRAKRDEVVDRLIGSPEFIEFWTNKWADLLQVNRKFLGPEGSAEYRKWIRGHVANNTPYDEFARQILTAKGSNKENPPASYYKVLRNPQDTLENTTHLFLAIRFNCNKCHDHPFEKWTQDNYYQTAAYFAQVNLKTDPQSKGRNIGGTAVEGAKPLFEIVEDSPQGEVLHERTQQPTPPKFPFDCKFEADPNASRRERLAAWMTSPDNPYFARSYVNRLWGYLFGVGIIEPIDDIRAGNPATNPELLDHLTEEFRANKFDMRAILRSICKSRTYQLSVAVNDWNKDDKINFSHAAARRLPAEVLYDAVHRVTGSVTRLPGVAPGTRAAELPDSGVDLSSGFLSTFGRPVRESACECERSNALQLGPVMALISGPTVADAVADPNNEIAKLVAAQADDRRVFEEIFLRVVNRPPTDAEIQSVLGVLQGLDADHQKLAAETKARADEVAAALPALEAKRNAAIAQAKAELEAHEKAIAPQVAAQEKQRQERIAKAKDDLTKYEATLAAKQTEWENRQTGGAWSILTPKSVKMFNNDKVKFAVEKDQAVFVTGENKKGTIFFEAETELQGLTGLRIEFLPDERLPKHGPGRADDGNFVLNEIDVDVSPVGEAAKRTSVELQRPKADFVQTSFDVKQLIDGAKAQSNGLAVGGATGRVHWITVEFKQPVALGKTTLLRVQLHHNFNREGFLLGKFRVSATTAARPLGLTLPESLRAVLEVEADKRTPEGKALAAEYFRGTEPGFLQRKETLAKAEAPLPVEPRLAELREKLETVSRPIPPDRKLVRLQTDLAAAEAQQKNKRLTVAQDLTWALMNTPEFLFNH